MASTMDIVPLYRLGSEWKNKQWQCFFSFFPLSLLSAHFTFIVIIGSVLVREVPGSATLWVQLRDKVCCWWIGFFVREDVFVNAMKARRGLRSDKVHCLKGVSGLLYAPHHQKNDKERCFHKMIKMQLLFILHRPLDIKHSPGNSSQKKHKSLICQTWFTWCRFLCTFYNISPIHCRNCVPDHLGQMYIVL